MTEIGKEFLHAHTHYLSTSRNVIRLVQPKYRSQEIGYPIMLIMILFLGNNDNEYHQSTRTISSATTINFYSSLSLLQYNKRPSPSKRLQH